MRNGIARALVSILLALSGAFAQAQRNAPGASATVSDPVPRRSTRMEVFSSSHTFAAVAKDWHFGVETGAFQTLTFSEALGKIDSLNLAEIEGSSAQELSKEIPKKLDYNLKPGELRAVRDSLRSWNLRMPAYFTPNIGPDEVSMRKLFEFAKSIGVETIVSDPEPRLLPQLDQLANEFGINIALLNRSRKETPAYSDPGTLVETIHGLSTRIGAAGDVGHWAESGIRASDAIARLKERLLVLNLRADGAADDLTSVIRAMDENHLKPRFIAIFPEKRADTYAGLSISLEHLDKALQPTIAAYVNALSKRTPNLHTDLSTPASQRDEIEAQEAKDLSRYNFTPAEIKAQIDSVIAAQPHRTPAKKRKLLVIDLCVGYNGHIASRFWINYALEASAKQTGGFEVVFRNDLSNLSYDKVRQFDAVYLNNTVGELFPDQEVRDGLLRFVREGGGLGGNHGVPYASMDWKEFGDMLGTVHGVHRENTEKATVRIDDPRSPLTQSFNGQEFLRTDEFFRFPSGPYSRDKLHVLLSMDVPNTDMNQGLACSRPCYREDSDYALSWIHNYGKGRVFYCALGHQPTLFTTPALASYMLAGIEFMLGDLPADTTPSAKLHRK